MEEEGKLLWGVCIAAHPPADPKGKMLSGSQKKILYCRRLCLFSPAAPLSCSSSILKNLMSSCVISTILLAKLFPFLLAKARVCPGGFPWLLVMGTE